MRLWELEEGDEDGQNFFAGGRGGQQAPRNEQQIAEIALEEAIVGDEGVDNHHQPEQRRVLNENGRRVDVEREGPLVLRIDAGAAPAPGARGGRQPAPQQRGGAQNRGRGNPAGRGRQQAAQQGRGGRARGIGPRQNQIQGPNHNFIRRDRQVDAQHLRDEADQEEVQAGEAAWIRHFVQLALNDNEDLIDQDD